MNEGLKHLAIQAQKHRIQFKDSSKVVILPLFAFLDQLLASMKKFTNIPHFLSSWAEFIVISMADKHFSNLYGSWLAYNIKSLEAKLISTLLPCNSPSKISMFLKLRKFVLKTKPQSNKNLDCIQLDHSDIIGIVHSVYHNPDSRKQITQGIKSLFISYRMQQAKIYSCVFIEYALSLHEEIHARENNEATIGQQHESYGTVPQSILGFSSIASQKQQTKKTQANRSTNSSQYISNFQSIIHDQNGLYRKMKSSQVSLQGFKVIDHKFVNNSPLTYSKMDQSHTQSKANRNGVQSRHNFLDSIEEENSAIKSSQIKNQNRFEIYRNQNRDRTPQGRPTTAMTPTKLRPQNPMIRSGGKKFEHQMRKQDLQRSQNMPNRSPTYSQKFRSPDLQFDLTPEPHSNSKAGQLNSKIKRSLVTEGNERDSPNSRGYDQNYLKLIKVEQQQKEEAIKDKSGGYDMFKKLTERNKSFIEKMLHGNLDRRQMATKQLPETGNDYQSISVIHDSIVRHSGIDRWGNGRTNQELPKNEVKMK